MSENGVLPIRTAAKQLGVSRYTVSDLVRLLGIEPKPMTNGKAKGLDASDLRRIRRALGLTGREAKPEPAATA